MHTLQPSVCSSMLRRTQERLVMANGVADRNLVIVAFGDSVTAGFTAPGHIDHENVYHAVFQRWLTQQFPQAIVSMINAGRGGDAVIHALDRVERDVIAHHPDLVIICFGLNDYCGGPAYLPTFGEGLRAMIDQVRALDSTEILLLTPNPVQGDGAGGCDLEEYVDAIRDVARDKQVALADAYLAWQQRLAEGVPAGTLLTGGAHRPSAEGHRLLAEAIIALFDRIHLPSYGG
jgi:acyl-CoA thioesterase-1